MDLKMRHEYRGHYVEVYLTKIPLAMVGGAGFYAEYRAVLDGVEDVTRMVAVSGGATAWIAMAEELIDQLEVS